MHRQPDRFAARTGRRAWALALAALLVVAGCQARESEVVGDPWMVLGGWPEHEAEAIRIGGVVEARDLEGGIWVVRDPDGAEWVPLELPEPFRIDGAGVVADVRLRPDLLSIGMTGTLVEILRIRHGSVAAGTGAAEALPDGDPAAPPSDLIGQWRIGETHRPGVSAGSLDGAWWSGQEIRYGADFAYGPDAECGRASYEVRRVTVDALLSGRFGVPPDRVPPLAGADEVRLVEVRCGTAAWDALGAVVLLLDDSTALVAWEGAFLELASLR